MLNRVIMMGRLTAEPECKNTQSGTTFCRFTIAVDRDFADKGGDRQADFFGVLAWRGTADFVSNYFHKGQLVAVQGRIQTGSYTDKDGNKRKSWDIVADQVYFAESKRDSGENQQAKKNVNVEYEDHQPAETFVQVSDDLPF